LLNRLLSGIATLGERRHQRMGSQAKLFSPVPTSYVPSGAVAVSVNNGNGTYVPPSNISSTPNAARSVAISGRATGNAGDNDMMATSVSIGNAPPRQLTHTASTPMLKSSSSSTPLLKSIQ
jgi:hypothetical protein